MTQTSNTPPASRALSSTQPPTSRILIVDDEPESGQLCKGALSTVRGYMVRYEQDPRRAQGLVREWQPDLVILDVMMDALDGITLGQRLTAEEYCHADLMFVTGRVETETELDGLEFAEEYIKKPYDVQVLVARVKKVLSRRQHASGSSQAARSARSSRPTIDPVSNTVHVPYGTEEKLTQVELELLLALLEGNGKPVPYETLLAQWEPADEGGVQEHASVDTSTKRYAIIHTNVSRLRNKIELNPKQPELIVNVPRIGYCYVLRHDQP
jgi:DNA-binding response OmpR family regulator